MELGLSEGSALVTGAAQGIGLAIAKHFAEEGCDLHLWDQSSDILAIADQIADQYSVSVVGQEVDIGKEQDVTRAAGQLSEAKCRPLRYVVHAAAIGSGCFGFPFTNLKASDWDKPLQVNLMGMVHVAHHVTPVLVNQQGGSFVFIGSVAGQIGSQTDPPYSATKAANINFTQCMAKDLARHRIRANMVCPGMVKTELAESVWRCWAEQQADSQKVSYEEWADEKIRSVIPLGTWQTAEDISNMVLFLSSNRAAQVTGQIINVDGGYVMHW